jgi:hypothetical protein
MAWLVKSAGTLDCSLWLDRDGNLTVNRDSAKAFVTRPDAQDAVEKLKQSRNTGPMVFYIVDAETRPEQLE